MLISYVMEAGLHGHGMDELAELHLGHECIPFKEICGTGKNQISFDKVPLDKATQYAAEDADVTLRLWELLKPALVAKKKATVYETLERPMAKVLADMERAGIKVDPDQLRQLSSDFARKMAAAEAAAHKAAGRAFNVASPKQIGEILFGEMGLPGGKKTKTGAWSTDVTVLDQLAAEGHDLPVALLEYRQFAKLKSTYSDALFEHINPATKRVHGSFSLAATTTGRLSSTEPNLQNIPIRTEEGRKIREVFIAEPGHCLVAADYSQIELRLLAHIADVESLKQAFRDGADIHAMTASEVFGVPVEGMDPMVRRKAKAINFGVIYGISAFGLANQIDVSREEAKAFIDAYFAKFPGIADYMDRMKSEVKERGYVETVFGRRCHFPSIKDKNPNMRMFAERQAINAPIQGSAADVIRRAMIRMDDALRAASLDARMLLQVHDELVFEVPENQADDLIALASKVMGEACAPAVELSVPLEVDAKKGKSWAEAH
jgi:DNA polymerase-1